MQTKRAHGIGGLFIAVLAIGLSSPARAAEEKSAGALDRQVLDRRLAAKLRQIVGEGAQLYNDGYHSACAHLFQGALMTVEPLLDHHPDAQRAIQKGLADAKKLKSADDRAWLFRDLLVTVRRTIEPQVEVTLWEQLGGERKVTKMVDHFVNAAIADPKVNFFRNGKHPMNAQQIAALKKQFVVLASAVSGGPDMGPVGTMKAVHKGMGITNDEFDAFKAKMHIAMQRENVDPAVQKRILGAVETTRGDIVEASTPGIPQPLTLWERLGGEQKVIKIVDKWVEDSIADPKVNFFRDGKHKMNAQQIVAMKSQLVDLASAVSGGPRKYTGKTMKDIHQGMNITETEFDRMVDHHLRISLLKHIDQPEVIELILKAVKTTKRNIVGSGPAASLEHKDEGNNATTPKRDLAEKGQSSALGNPSSAPREIVEQRVNVTPHRDSIQPTVVVSTSAPPFAKFLPKDSQIVWRINVQQILHSEVFKKLMREFSKNLFKGWLGSDPLKDMTAADMGAAIGDAIIRDVIGLTDVKDLTDVKTEVVKDVTAITGAASSLDNVKDKSVLIVQGKFDVAKFEALIAAKAKEAKGNLKSHSTGGYQVYEIIRTGKENLFVGLLDASNLVVAPTKELVVDAFDQKAGKKKAVLNKELVDLLNQVDLRRSLSVAALGGSLGNAAGYSETTKAAADKLKSLMGGITVGEDVKLEVMLNTKDAAGAYFLNKSLNVVVAEAKGLVGLFAAQEPKFAPLIDILNTIKINSKGNDTTLTSEISRDLIEKAINNIFSNG